MKTEENSKLMKIQIINGPNLNLLGVREPGIYGSQSFEDYLPGLRRLFPDVEIDYYQSNVEGFLIDRLQQTLTDGTQGVVLNAGAYTHTSVAIRDALLGVSVPFFEVHISNVHAREEFRHHSYLSDKAAGVICGFGSFGYECALRRAAMLLSDGKK